MMSVTVARKLVQYNRHVMQFEQFSRSRIRLTAMQVYLTAFRLIL